ncbi:ADP-heptose--LPS heptosyltransferase 2 [Gammaproteobacteria bacterium]
MIHNFLDFKNMSYQKILIIGPSWIGDLVMVQSVFQVLKTQDPTVLIDVVAPPWCAPLLARMPEVQDILTLPIGHGHLDLKSRWAMGKMLRNRQYSQAILFPRSLKSVLIPYFSRIPRRTGWLGEMRWGLLNDIRPRIVGKMVEEFVALGLPPKALLPTPVPLPRLIADRERANILLKNFGIEQSKPILALCPGAAFGPAKQWPVTHFATVAREASRNGWQVWLFGSPQDITTSKQIQELASDNVYDFVGKMPLLDSIDLLALANAVVTNDSGLMHVAAALDRFVIAVFGSSDPNRTPPLHPNAIIVRRNDLPCSPCLRRTCRLRTTECLDGLSPEFVLNAIFDREDPCPKK